MHVVPGAARAQEAVEGGQDFYFGAGSCAAQACHGGAFEERQEYKIWATRDKHSKAYEVLTGALGQRIGQRLGLEPAQAPECLNCHGTVGVRTAATYDPHDGVSCEHCHGGARDWLGPHAAPGWQKLSPGEKARRGYRDLTTPAKRAAACVGCHVAAKGRDITHDIMAAGHPPLVFDAAKFMEDLPPHWADAQDLSVATWVEGLKTNAAARLEQVARTADRENGAPDFTIFDCYACHHPVYTGSVYEKSAPPGRPGDLPLELSSLKVLLAAAGDEALLKRFEKLLAKTLVPGDDARVLGYFAAQAAKDVRRLFPDAATYGPEQAAAFLAHLDTRLTGVEAGGTRTPRAEMQQLALAIHALSPYRARDQFKTAFAELDRALDLTKPYEAAACARLARQALAAGR
jgi:hypothetical protein